MKTITRRRLRRRASALAAVAASFLLPTPLAHATDYILTNQTLSLNSATYTADDTLITSNVTFTASITKTLPASLSLASGTTTANITGALTLAGPVSGTSPFVKIGTGTLALSAVSPGFAGPFVLETNGGTLRLDVESPLPGAAPLNIKAGATLDLNGFNSAGSRPSVVGSASVLNNNVAATSTLSTIPHVVSGTLTLGGAGTMEVADFANPLPPIKKSGTGLLLLSSPNFAPIGTVNVNQGTLRLNNAQAIPSNTTFTIGPGTLDLNGYNLPSGSYNFNAGSIVNDNPNATSNVTSLPPLAVVGTPVFGGAGNINFLTKAVPLTKNGAGALTLSTAHSSFSGTITVNAGTLRLNTAGALGGAGAKTINLYGASGTSFGVLDLNGFPAPTATYIFNGGALINDNTSTPATIPAGVTLNAGTGVPSFGGNGDLVSSVALPQTFVKIGTGALPLTQSQSLANTFVLDGVLRLATAASYSGSLTITGSSSINAYRSASLDLNGRPSTSLALTLYNNAGIVNDNSATPATLGGGISVSFPNVAPPITNISLGGNGTLHVTNTSLAAKTIDKVGAGLLTFSNGFSPPAVVLRAGTLQVESNNHLGSSVTFLGGALRVAPLALPGAPSYTFTPSLSVDASAGGTIDTQRNTTLTGSLSGSGTLAKTGTASLTLTQPLVSVKLDLLAGTLRFPNPAATVRQYLLAGRITSSSPDPDDTHSLAYSTAAGTTTVQLTLTGDANLDGLLNADDFAAADKGLLTAANTWSLGDFNYDATVNHLDFLLLDSTYAKQYGGSLSPALLSERASQFGPAYLSSLLTAIPEPTLALSSILYPLSALLKRRRR